MSRVPVIRAQLSRARLVLAIAVAHVARRLLLVLHLGSGTSIPGRVAMKIYPGLLSTLACQLTDGSVVVTGTNGKTTTTALICAAARANGRSTVTNAEGANLIGGVASCLVKAASIRGGRMRETLGVFEVDEAALAETCRQLRPSTIVGLNLMRDQLDRHCEIDSLAQLMTSAFATSGAHVIANADDPLVVHAATQGRSVDDTSFFGVSSQLGRTWADLVAAADCRYCPQCGFLLDYVSRNYAHLGRFSCSRCGLERPQPDVEVIDASLISRTASSAEAGERRSLMLRVPHALMQVTRRAAGPSEAYSVAAALAVAAHLGWDMHKACAAISACPPVAGRDEIFDLGATRLRLVLAKNPAGVAASLAANDLTSSPQPLLIVVNDGAADGRDVSWLWDAPFELLPRRTPLIVSGDRAEELATRLRYADLEAVVRAHIPDALAELEHMTRREHRGLVMANYTAMSDVRRTLERMRRRIVVGLRL